MLRRGFKVISTLQHIDHAAFWGAEEVADDMMEAFKEGKYDKVEMVYNEFKNVATQVLRKLTPLAGSAPK